MRSRLCAGLLLVTLSVRAEESDAPDPTRGERYDGRVSDPQPSRAALWVPRILFAPFWLLSAALEQPTRLGIELEERHHLYDHMIRMSTSEDGMVGIRPTFEWASSFRWSVGAHVFDDKLLGPGTKFRFDIAGGIDVAHLQIRGRPTRLGRPVQVFFDSRFDHRNDYLFTGIGTDPPVFVKPHGASRYKADVLDLGGRIDFNVAPWVAFSIGGDYGFRKFYDSESYKDVPPIQDVYCVRVEGVCIPGTVSEALVPGFNQGTQFVRTSAAVHFDLRNHRVRPTLGALLDAEADYSKGIGDVSSYFRFRESVALDFNLWAHSHVLVLRGDTELVVPAGNDFVPFSELATVGGPQDLRGFRISEFRGFSSLTATAEYRWPIMLWVDAMMFVDYGGVFDRNYKNFGASQLHPDVGFGFRVATRDRFYLRLQVAYGFDHGWEVYLSGMNLP